MTEAQKEARRKRMAEVAKKRSTEIEKQQLAEVEAVWHLLDDEKKRIFDYIRKQIPKRDPDDVAFLRETRAIHLAPYKRMMKKEVSYADA